VSDATAPIVQQKVVSTPTVRTRTWDLDLGAMTACASWAARSPELLRDEMSRLHGAFPMLIAAVGQRLSEERSWVEAAEPLTCPACGELVVFDRGTRCAACEREVAKPAGAMVGVVGRIPALITGRPFARALDARLARLREAGDARAELIAKSLLTVGERRYLAPRFGLWFAQSWPHADPPVMVWHEYFEVLEIPPDHVYYADQYYRLCLFATWREQAAAQVLQNRVVPRLLIDLMVADLQAVGRLDEALDRLDSSLYELYNAVGRPDAAEPLQRVYEELVRS
jgi:hypothetical protein